ncbi:hypothetical protein LEP1GSC050_0029 [Leptospira phage vB_LbrZ_5399-LE1]|uniref:SMODS and SLOG-associating 2TM effector domain-containing protein n=1 Tax=Leptospira inadai serovar Lyme TaxID=293084 RepID=A0ABX4YGJ7_9LEPT|nr:hypothetical protein [Leptospira inadai]AGS80704.1 hypothetical protein LEP1GSC050_0029 [Leptospira phage vB_LbrZ_5399-LE1]AGS80845.1 hypothetical protein LEP1GSC047_0842 [Leptospira phage vB_LinZ_10-LE1]PNV74295.1 hypothetical protein BES34_014000 [Leptospira inadai serovar Lyme]
MKHSIRQKKDPILTFERAYFQTFAEIESAFDKNQVHLLENEEKGRHILNWVIYLKTILKKEEKEPKVFKFMRYLLALLFGSSLGVLHTEILEGVFKLSLWPFFIIGFVHGYLSVTYATIEIKKERKERIGNLMFRFSELAGTYYLGQGPEEVRQQVEIESRTLSPERIRECAESLLLAKHVGTYGWDTPVKNPIFLRNRIQSKEHHFQFELNHGMKT